MQPDRYVLRASVGGDALPTTSHSNQASMMKRAAVLFDEHGWNVKCSATLGGAPFAGFALFNKWNWAREYFNH